LWLNHFLFIGSILYIANYSPSAQALILLGGIVLGQGLATWVGFGIKNQNKDCFLLIIVSLLVLYLALVSLWNVDVGYVFEYRRHTRWSGPWDNPNIFGLFMALALLFSFGIACGAFRLASGRFAVLILCLIARTSMLVKIYDPAQPTWTL